MIKASDLPKRDFSKKEMLDLLKFNLDCSVLFIESGKHMNTWERGEQKDDIIKLMQFFLKLRNLIR